MKRIVTVSLALGLATALMAKPNIPNTEMKAKISEIAGKKGVFAPHEKFPKDYFLISKNLPFSVGLTLHHPESSTLELTKEQIAKIQEIKGTTIPVVIKSAKEIKALELALSDKMVKGAKASDMGAEVDKIATMKATLTKAHLKCIESVREVLTEKQRKTLLSYAGKKMKHGGDKHHKIAELVPLPHPVKIVLQNEAELKVSKEQKEKIDKEMLAVFPEKIHGGMDKAEVIEDKIKKAVLMESKTKEDLKADIKALADLKIQITNDHIDALNHLSTILNKEQFSKVLELSKKKHKH